jgi:hypothetical protein
MRRRLWDDGHRDLVTGILAAPETWDDAFDQGSVHTAWRAASSGDSGLRDEQLLQRVVWRALFDDHLAAVNDVPLPERRDIVGAGGARPATRLLRPLRRAAVWANEIPVARRAAATRGGRAIRRRLRV